MEGTAQANAPSQSAWETVKNWAPLEWGWDKVREWAGAGGACQVPQVSRGLRHVLSRRITRSWLHFFFLIALFLLLILNLIIFLLENLENINAFLYIGTPKVCNVYKNEEDTSTCICIF